MSLSFNIKKLGPIRNSFVEFRPLMFFTGESNSGKSYLASLVHYAIKYLCEGEFELFLEEHFDKEITALSEGGTVEFPIKPKIVCGFLDRNAKSYLEYLFGAENLNYSCEIISSFEEFEMNFSYYEESAATPKKRVLVQENSDERYLLKFIDSIGLIVSEIISNEVVSKVLNSGKKQTLFLPPSKSAFIQSKIDFILTNSHGIPGMYQEFLRDFLVVRSWTHEKPPLGVRKELQSFLNNYLKGNILEENEELYYEFKNTRIPISSAASSIKELAPLIIAVSKFKPESLSILFEEPESHLHPELQIETSKLIALLLNHGSFFQITTHSDIIIEELNVLIRLNNVYKKNKDLFKEYSSKFNISRKHLVDNRKIGAYLFERTPSGTTIVNKEDTSNGIMLKSFSKAIDDLYEQTGFVDSEIDI